MQYYLSKYICFCCEFLCIVDQCFYGGCFFIIIIIILEWERFKMLVVTDVKCWQFVWVVFTESFECEVASYAEWEWENETVYLDQTDSRIRAWVIS